MVLVVGSATFFLVPAGAWAGAAGSTALSTLSSAPARGSAGGAFSYVFPADLERGEPGDVSIVRYTTGVTYRFPGSPAGFLSVNANYEYTDYDWSEADLFGETHRFVLSAVGLRRFAESKWGLFGFGQLSVAAERPGDLGRGFSSTVILGPAYSFSRDLTLTTGILANTQPERSSRAFPVAAVDWRINDEWSLRTLNGAILSYAPNAEERLQVDFSAEYRTRGVRLRRQVLPDDSVGRPAVEEREVAIGAGVAWRLRENLIVQGYAEYLFSRRWQFREDKTRFRTVEAGDAPQAGLRLDYLF